MFLAARVVPLMDVVNYCDRTCKKLLKTYLRMKSECVINLKKQLPVVGSGILASRHVNDLSLLLFSICFINFTIQVPISCQIPPFPPNNSLITTATGTFNPPTHVNHLYPVRASFSPILGRPNLHPTINPQVFTGSSLDRRTEQSLMPRPGKLLADYVSHQGQRILKNLVNTTIADLVAQSTVRIVNPNKQHLVTGPFPTMGRLYTLLFPTQAPNATSTTMASASTISSQQLDGEHKQTPSTAEFGHQEQESSTTTGSEDQFSNFHHLNANQADESQTSSNDVRHLMSMSMGAPYDPKSRSNSMSDARIPRGSMQMMRANDYWHQPEQGLMQDSSGLFMTSGSEQHVESNTGADSSEPSEMGTTELVDGDSLGNNYGEQVQATAHNGAVDVHQMTDGNEQDSQHGSVDSQTDLSSLFRSPNGNEQDQQLPTESKRGEEMDLSPPSTPEEESFIAPISQQLVESEMIQPTGGNDSTLDQMPGFAVSSEDFGDQFKQTTNLSSFEHQVSPSDDSYFTAHLPVQYETALRPPPEGHYDDYFKLLSSGGAPTDSEIQSQLAMHSQEDPAAFFNDSNDQLGNRSARQFVQDNKLKADLNSYQPVRRPRDHSSINYDGPNGTGGLQYEVQHIYERVPYINQSGTHAPLNESGGLMNSVSESDRAKLRESMDSRYKPFHHRNSTTPTDDNLQVIIAKTNYGRDPMNQEKVINYTSENHNFTWSGKSPRNNFVNKDMNEMAVEPVETPNSTRFGSTPGTNSFRGPASTTSGGVDVGLLRPPPSPLPPPSPPVNEQHYIVGNLASGSIRFPQPTGQFESLAGQVQPQLVQIVEIEPKGQQGEANAVDQPMHLADAIQTIVNRQHLHQSAARQDQQQRPPAGERKRARGSPKRGRRFRGQKPQRSSLPNKASNGQPQRPQVTQVHLEQQNEPTTTATTATGASSPDTGRGGGSDAQSTGDMELKLPDKMKQLREHPPDKNELMNELLSALDRVKVAIYKLQPLTARMNAIYRKSVTANTRDTIMDKHKGTYAKRYPPGDFDDTYDRIQPTEIAQNEIASRSSPRESPQNPQASSFIPDRSAQPESSSFSSSTMATAEVTDEPVPRVGAELEASDSGTRTVYTRAPQGRLVQANRSSTKEGQRRWRRRVTSLELDSLNATESRVIATGIGRRFGDRNFATENESLGDNTPQRTVSSPSHQDIVSNQDSSIEGPLFGYRITIYQNPLDQDAGDADDQDSSKFAYRVDGLTEPAVVGLARTTRNDQQDLELMTTSESSVVNFKSTGDGAANSDSSSGSSYKKSAANGERDDNWKKSDSGKKEDGKEGKNQKEFKKIKHNKGLVSKERKSMHRNKNVKAHDRGAAKEKALKERTQIEFFEREQIVDDEFEKAKKSNGNVNWQSGHDSKKAIQAADLAADTISSGGSHYVNHRGPNEKSHTVGSEQTSGKKSSKSQRRLLEAKGKKFKGWREKGYKIITETEFIDRGSLHDSAYRKRDKGSASQQKYRHQLSASEGQHGTSIEQHKKLHKKEERRENGQQSKESRGRDEAKQEKARNKKSSKKPTGGSSAAESNDIEQSGSNKWEHLGQKRHPSLLSASSNTFRPALKSNDEPTPKALLRLLSSTHHEQHPDHLQFLNTSQDYNRSNSQSPSNQTSADEPRAAGRRADMVPKETTGRSKAARNVGQENSDRRNNATILDIVDNSTGRQVNKTKIGTYDLSQDDEHNLRDRNSSIPLSKIANSLARYSAYLARSQDRAANKNTPTTASPFINRNTNPEKQMDSNRIYEQQQINSNQSIRQQQQPPLMNSQNHNYNQNQNYNFDLMEYKRQLQLRANHQLNPYMRLISNPDPINQTPIDKKSSLGQFVGADQAQAAAEILRLVQRAAMKEPPVQTISGQAGAGYMDFMEPLQRSVLLAPGGVTPFGHIYPGAQQALTRPMAYMPSAITYGMNPFGQSRFNDFDQQHTFLAE